MVGCLSGFLLQLPPIEPGVRFSRTRLTDVLHRRCSTGARQARLGLGAKTMPLRETRPRLSGDRYNIENPHARPRLFRRSPRH